MPCTIRRVDLSTRTLNGFSRSYRLTNEWRSITIGEVQNNISRLWRLGIADDSPNEWAVRIIASRCSTTTGSVAASQAVVHPTPIQTFPHTAALQSTNQIDRVDVRPWRRPLRVHHESRTHDAALTACLPASARPLSNPRALRSRRSFQSDSAQE